MKHLRIAVAALLTLTTLLAGCGRGPAGQDGAGGKEAPQAGATGAGSGESRPGAKLRVGMLPIVDGLPFWVAEAQGYFREAGVEVELVNFRSADERDVALTAGQIDGAIADTVAATTLVASGARVKVISLSLGANPREGRFLILASPRSQAQTLEDLKGVPIAISNNSIIHYVTEKLLEEAGFRPEEIQTTSIPQIPTRFEMLMSGQVEAACLPDPLAYLAEVQGAKVLADDSKIGRNLSQSVILFTEKALAEKGDAVRTMLTAYNRAVADIAADPNRFRPLLVEKARLPEPIRDTYPVDPFSPAQLPTREQLEPVSAWLVAKGVIEAPVAYEDLVDGRFLP
ncbi:MAG: MetQ/NlpA family ABC transporter substrate-binding protein [Bacillota bacterium]